MSPSLVRFVPTMRECLTCGTRHEDRHGTKCAACGFFASVPMPGWYVCRPSQEPVGPFTRAIDAARRVA